MGAPLHSALVLALRSIRRERNETAEQVSLRMGRCASYITGLEHARRAPRSRDGTHRADGPSLRVLYAVAVGHGVSFTDLAARIERFIPQEVG